MNCGLLMHFGFDTFVYTCIFYEHTTRTLLDLSGGMLGILDIPASLVLDR